MRKFALIKIEQVKGKINFYKLEIDGNCEFDEFCDLLERKRRLSKLKSIYAIMECVSNMIRLPATKYKELMGRPEADNVKEYEIKKDAYRVYLFKDDMGNIIVFGGVKGNQNRDLSRFRRIKTDYIKSKQK